MTYKQKILLFALIVQTAFWASCSGSVEQPNFVSIYPISSSESKTPKLKSFSLEKGNALNFVLSGEVKKLEASAFLSSDMDKEIACVVELVSDDVSRTADTDKSGLNVYRIRPIEQIAVGEEFIVEGSIEGSAGDVLDFSLSFKGLNSRPAKLLFSEVKLGDTKKLGYIRFKVIESGNLSGMTLLMPANSWAKAVEYSFPVAEVKKGETIAYHWFAPPDSSDVVDELSTDVKCTNKYAHSDARDFWGRFKKFRPKRSNAIVLKSAKNGEVQDAVLFLNPKDDEWGDDAILSIAKEAAGAELWLPDAGADSAFNLNITASKKIVRRNMSNIKHSAADWVLVKDSRK